MPKSYPKGDFWDMRICLACKEEKEDIKFELRSNGRRNVCEQCRNLRKKLSHWLNFLRHFEFKCQCCGESDIRFLTVDHVQNDGYLDNKMTITILRRAKEEGYPKDKYNCLCWNCNCARAKNNGICPHKDSVNKEQYLNQVHHINKIQFPRGVPVGTIRGEYKHKYPGNKEERYTISQAVYKAKHDSKYREELIKILSS